MQVSPILDVFASFNSFLTPETAGNLSVLLRGAILAPSARTVTGCLTAAWPWATQHWTAYENVLRRANIPMLAMARLLFALASRNLPKKATIEFVIDESLVRRYGPYVVGVGMHRDAVRSSKSNLIVTPGHKWVVLALIVHFPLMRRHLALPLLCGLYTTKKQAKRNQAPLYRRRHRTSNEIAILLLLWATRWIKGRNFRVLGDGAYATHELAALLSEGGRHPRLRQGRLVSRFRLDAPTYAPPTPRRGKLGRPPIKGRRLKTPAECAEMNRGWKSARVDWYGSVQKGKKMLSRTGLWYKCGCQITPVRWVIVRDESKKPKDEVFFTTDLSLSPAAIIAAYVRRWSLETTFQEVREHLGLETLRNRCHKAIARGVPLLLSLYTLIVLAATRRPKSRALEPMGMPWYIKTNLTFSDLLTQQRRGLFQEMITEASGSETGEFILPGMGKWRGKLGSPPSRRAA